MYFVGLLRGLWVGHMVKNWPKLGLSRKQSCRGGVEDLFFQKFMLTPCDIPLVTPCDSGFWYPTLVTATIYPCDRPKYQQFTLVTKLITTFTLVTKYRSSSFFPLVTCQKWIFLPCDMEIFNFYPCDKNRSSTPPARLISGKAQCKYNIKRTEIKYY